MNISAISGAWRVFKAGEAVANPAAWKQGQVTANAVTMLLAALVALAKGLGYDLHLDDSSLAAIGAGLFALVNWVLTVVSTDKIGPFGGAAGPSEPVVRAGAEPAAQPHDAAGAQPSDAKSADPLQPVADDLSRQDRESMRAGG